MRSDLGAGCLYVIGVSCTYVNALYALRLNCVHLSVIECLVAGAPSCLRVLKSRCVSSNFFVFVFVVVPVCLGLLRLHMLFRCSLVMCVILCSMLGIGVLLVISLDCVRMVLSIL